MTTETAVYLSYYLLILYLIKKGSTSLAACAIEKQPERSW